MPEIPVTAITNYFSKIKKPQRLDWPAVSSGPKDNETWSVQCVDGKVWGTGTGSSKKAGREGAAKEALPALRNAGIMPLLP
ncbi:hypothetical protein DFP72DRAFT_1076295 [Ephemerocybe angulata]|uniref:DRBM domain-containing protein n=1 Tax=Ephemerocybe angulata TaxID=980116 RepID=A0A8H6LZP1_9AGAR|nr:hypothetical protein DFP72DRAFT_1076295 [Tulosesus angulatus]